MLYAVYSHSSFCLRQMAVITIVMQQPRGNCVSVGIVMEQLRGINVWVENAASVFCGQHLSRYILRNFE